MLYIGVNMANYKWVNGELVDTDIGKGLGRFKIDTSTPVDSSTLATTSTPNKYTSMGFGTDTTNTTDITDYTKSSRNMFGDIFGSDGFGMNKGTMQGLGSIGQIGSGIGQLFLGAKQMGLAEDKFEFDKDMLNKQYAMAKENYDRQKARSESIGNQMQSGKV